MEGDLEMYCRFNPKEDDPIDSLNVFTAQTTDGEFYAKMEQEMRNNAQDCSLFADVLKRHEKFISWKTEQEWFLDVW